MPSPSLDSSRSLAVALRSHLARHNLQVLGFSVLTAGAAVLLWTTLYVFSYWLTIFGITVARGPEAAMPPGFSLGFAMIAGGLLFAAWIDRWATPNALPPDKKRPLEIALDFLLATPRATLAIWGNLSAWQRLTRPQIELAADFLAQLMPNRRMAVHAVPLEIPDDTVRDKIVFALLVTGVIEMRREQGISYLHLARRGHRLLLRAA
jgi:hypothetical protein